MEKLAGPVPAARRAIVRELRNPFSGEILDKAMVLWFPGPGSFTGEDIAELHVHGGSAVISAVLETLSLIPETRPAEPGEFTYRAFEHGRMTLLDVEGLAALIDAETTAQRRQALRHATGATAAAYDALRARLLRLTALGEASIDFSDEGDVPDHVAAEIEAGIGSLIEELQAILRCSRQGERLREGLAVVIAGSPNVGKSSLMNRLAQRDVAIVSHHAGTTRDTIEVHLDLNGYPVCLVDTAGLRESAGDEIEREGMARTRNRLDEADVVIWMTGFGEDAGEPPVETDSDTKVIRVINKIDLDREGASVTRSGQIRVSAKTGEGFDSLLQQIGHHAQELMFGGETALVTRLRHRQALEACVVHLERSARGGSAKPIELVLEDLRLGTRELERLIGRVDVESVLGEIFSQFCIGK